MKTMDKEDFKKWLKKKNFQKRIDKLAKRHEGQSVLIYGAGILSAVIFDNYNLSNLNIIGVSDNRFNREDKTTFKGYQAIPACDIDNLDMNVIFIATYNTFEIEEFLEERFEDKKIEIGPLVNKTFIEKLVELFST